MTLRHRYQSKLSYPSYGPRYSKKNLRNVGRIKSMERGNTVTGIFYLLRCGSILQDIIALRQSNDKGSNAMGAMQIFRQTSQVVLLNEDKSEADWTHSLIERKETIVRSTVLRSIIRGRTGKLTKEIQFLLNEYERYCIRAWHLRVTSTVSIAVRLIS